MTDDVSALVEKLASPLFTYRMARGLIDNMRLREHALRPIDLSRLRNAEKRLVGAEREITRIVGEWATSHGYTLTEDR